MSGLPTPAGPMSVLNPVGMYCTKPLPIMLAMAFPLGLLFAWPRIRCLTLISPRKKAGPCHRKILTKLLQVR